MKAKFLGDPADQFSGPRVLRAFGRAFPKGRFVTLEGDGAEAVYAKLAANSHFEVGEGEGEADLTPIEPEITEAEIRGETDEGADVTDDPGTADEKAELLARLEALAGKHPQATITFDGRWGVPKLKAALEAAQFELGDD